MTTLRQPLRSWSPSERFGTEASRVYRVINSCHRSWTRTFYTNRSLLPALLIPSASAEVDNHGGIAVIKAKPCQSSEIRRLWSPLASHVHCQCPINQSRNLLRCQNSNTPNGDSGRYTLEDVLFRRMGAMTSCASSSSKKPSARATAQRALV